MPSWKSCEVVPLAVTNIIPAPSERHMSRKPLLKQDVSYLWFWVKLPLVDCHQLIHQGVRCMAPGYGKVANLPINTEGEGTYIPLLCNF